MHIQNDYPTSSQQSENVVTGTVWSEVLAESSDPAVIVNRAHFSPGARTSWHTHTRGQILLIEAGVALVQEEGQPVQLVRAGGTVVCTPGRRHWHGAGPRSTMLQLGITYAESNGDYAVWGPHVTDEEYGEHVS